VKQIHEVLRVGFEPGAYGLEVQHLNHSATLSPFLISCSVSLKEIGRRAIFLHENLLKKKN